MAYKCQLIDGGFVVKQNSTVGGYKVTLLTFFRFEQKKTLLFFPSRDSLILCLHIFLDYNPELNALFRDYMR